MTMYTSSPVAYLAAKSFSNFSRAVHKDKRTDISTAKCAPSIVRHKGNMTSFEETWEGERKKLT